MSSTDNPADLLSNLRPTGRAKDASPPSEAAEAVIAALDDADVSLDTDDESVTLLPDSGSDAIEILDAEPMAAGEAPLAGAIDPVDLIQRRAKNERPRDRIAALERQLRDEKDHGRAAVLQHEIAVVLERTAQADTDAAQGYAAALQHDPALRPNLWALRRIYYRRGMWPSLLRLLDLEADSAASPRERAELLTEKGHILEDRLGNVEEALTCYRTAHELDQDALAPIVALEKVLTRQAGESALASTSTRPSDELLSVYRSLLAATKDPGRRVALLIEQARIEEIPRISTDGKDVPKPDVTAALNYLHDAYDVGVDQLRVIDEIVRITAAAGRIPDCLTALEIRAEILEMQAENATQQRKQLLNDQIVGIRRWQANLARERIGNLELAWQYLEKAQEKSPADPLLGPELLTVADAQGQPERLIQQLLERERELRIQRPEDAPPPVGVWLRQALALRGMGNDEEADRIEAKVAEVAPSHLLLEMLRRRRAMRNYDLSSLATQLVAEAERAAQGIVGKDGVVVRDPLWAVDALIAATDCALQAGDLATAETLAQRAEALLPNPMTEAGRVPRRLLDAQLEEIYLRSSREGLLAGLFEGRIADGQITQTEEVLLRETLIELYSGILGSPENATPHKRALERLGQTDLRIQRREVLKARQRGNLAEEEAALAQWIQAVSAKAKPPEADLLRRAELLQKLGRSPEASPIYEKLLEQHPGHPQALEELLRVYLGQGKKDELVQLLQRQIEQVAGKEDDSAVATERTLRARLIDLFEHELNKPDQAAAQYKAMLQRDPQSLPALSALLHHQRRSGDGTKLAAQLAQLAEHAPTSLLRGDALLRLAELKEEGGGRPQDVDELYEQALQALPMPSAQATHAAVGRLRAVMQQRKYDKLADVLEALSDSLSSDDPQTADVVALLREEQAALLMLSATPTSTAMERADAQLAKASKDLRQTADGKTKTATLVQLASTRVLLNQRREDGKAQGVALTELAELLLSLEDPGAKFVAAELLIRAGIEATLYDDDPGGRIEAARRLLLAYRTLGDQPQVVIPLTDLLSDPTVLEPMAQLPDVVQALRARQTLCPDSEIADRVAFILLESEAFLIHSSIDEVDDQTAAKLRKSAAEAALRAIQIDPTSIQALLLLRQATAPSDAELDPLRDEPLSPEGSSRLRAYAMYTLRMASLLIDSEARTDLYSEAGQLLLRLSDQDGAAAALRTALDGRPFDSGIFGPLLTLLQRRAEQTSDNGPLLELLDFRLSQVARTDEEKQHDLPLRIQLLSQRAALHLLTGQNVAAASDLETLLSLSPDHLLSHRRLAALRAHHGDLAAATMHYRRLLDLSQSPTEKLAIHRALGELLQESTPEHAVMHLGEALRIGADLRRESGTAETTDEIEQRVDLHKRLLGLELQKGDRAAAHKTLKTLVSELPTAKELATLRQQVLIEVAGLYERELGDREAALQVLQTLLDEQPLHLAALERIVTLTQASGETARSQGVLNRARDEARKQAATLADVDTTLSVVPFATLSQVFDWQKQSDARSLAAQATATVERAQGGSAEMPPPPPAKLPERSVGPPLRSAAFSADARGILLDMWQEVWETGSKLLGPDLTQLSPTPRDRINAKKVPPAWTTVDTLAQRFGLGNTDLSIAYTLVAGKEKDACVAVGQNLVCGSSFGENLSAWSPQQFFRIVRRLSLLPDRLGVIDCAPAELLLFFAACCQLIGVPTPSLAAAEKSKLDEKVRNLDRAIARKEKNGLRGLSSRMSELAGENGKNLVLGWQRTILRGSAQLAMAITGNLSAALKETGAKLDTDDEHEAKTARALLTFSVSPDLLKLRRELGLTEKE